MVDQHDIDQLKVSRLTDKQRECLRLVVLRKSSKEIARELGIAKPTVDQRIANARQILGARNRDEAAIIFARGTGGYDRVIYDPVCVPKASAFKDNPEQEIRQSIGLRLEETAIPFSRVFEHQPSGLPDFLGRHPNNVNTAQRLFIIVGMTVGILCIILVGLSVAQSLSELLTSP